MVHYFIHKLRHSGAILIMLTSLYPIKIGSVLILFFCPHVGISSVLLTFRLPYCTFMLLCFYLPFILHVALISPCFVWCYISRKIIQFSKHFIMQSFCLFIIFFLQGSSLCILRQHQSI